LWSCYLIDPWSNAVGDAVGGCQEAAIWRSFPLSRGLDKEICPGCHCQPKLTAYFLLGALFSLVRAPCVGGMYVANIGAISSQGSASSGLVYLLIYNLGIALPVLILGGIVTLGMSPEQVDQFRQRHRVAIRLLTGITLIALAPLIYWQMI